MRVRVYERPREGRMVLIFPCISFSLSLSSGFLNASRAGIHRDEDREV